MLLIFNLLQSGYYTTEPVASRYDAATMGMFVLIIVIGVIGYIVQARLQHVFKKILRSAFPRRTHRCGSRRKDVARQ